MFQVFTTPTFDNDIKRLNREVAKRIIAKIEQIAQKPQLLKGYLGYMPKDLAHLQKYRIGDWRVLFWVDKKKQRIVLYGVDHRSRVYKRIRK